MDEGHFFVFGGTINTMERQIKTLTELETETASFVGGLNPKKDRATFVTLSGELGAGKTAFVKAVAKALGVEETVNSPTFVLEKIYQLSSEALKFKRLIHLDAYRLENGSELTPLGFDEIMSDKSNLIFLEWPERVADALPAPDVKISFVVHTDEARTISYG